MFDWLKRIWPPAPKQVAPPINPIKPDPIPFRRGYSLEEFRSNAALVEQARQFLNESALGGHIMAVLYNAAPSGYLQRGAQVDGVAAALELGRVQGHLGVITILQALTIQNVKDEAPEVDYGASEKKDGDDWENVPLQDARQKE